MRRRRQRKEKPVPVIVQREPRPILVIKDHLKRENEELRARVAELEAQLDRKKRAGMVKLFKEEEP